ncbi:acetyl-CoA carboxylase biotin carboxyl carrier protein [Candidatus Persebacteraceae bacterium Df01]|uniref:Biotin carboxyl carrier protein of acetyl-CoA carboxylase n=1 Tax=Candidatus Doriopsillibacter californiensis TaxID=2970740 RepID=A0ABT7QJK2_9GAMM|nr:acetyl-CoA carboxylase biotin carboxyl carrier protein [Candidatus Persebacteraceae bacterium Df01]
MDLRKLKTILELFEGSTVVTELEISEGDDKLRLAKGAAPLFPVAPTPAVVVPSDNDAVPAKPVTPAAEEPVKGTTITSPMVGTFYRAPSPEMSPFVRVGQTVEAGETLCIIEAMKLMNEIPATVSGKVISILAESGGPVSYGDSLFIIE